VTTLRDGNQLSGAFNVSFAAPLAGSAVVAATAAVPFDATPALMKAALESVGTGEVAVHRAGPDYELGYVWTVSFLEAAGDLPLVGAAAAGTLFGKGGADFASSVREGTEQGVQTIVTDGGGDGAVNASSRFCLRFRGQVTGPIFASPNGTDSGGGGCDATAREVQEVATTTVDSRAEGGDDHVSSGLFFSLVFYAYDGTAEETAPIYANPAGGSCVVVGVAIKNALQALAAIETVTVVASPAVADESCRWRVTFDDQSGNLPPMSVVVQGGVNTGAAASGFFGDDAVAVSTLKDGTVDAIKYELQSLATVGTVTVSPGNRTSTGGCAWRVTFDTNTGPAAAAGALARLEVAAVLANGTAGPFADAAVSATDASDRFLVCPTADLALGGGGCVNGSSVQLGGQWTAAFRGQRTLYLPFDATARGVKEALEALPTIGRVDVARAV
jgi:hypothetical protein